jgi:hypothetical protein
MVTAEPINFCKSAVFGLAKIHPIHTKRRQAAISFRLTAEKITKGGRSPVSKKARRLAFESLKSQYAASKAKKWQQ